MALLKSCVLLLLIYFASCGYSQSSTHADMPLALCICSCQLLLLPLLQLQSCLCLTARSSARRSCSKLTGKPRMHCVRAGCHCLRHGAAART